MPLQQGSFFQYGHHLHLEFFDDVSHLDAMNQRGASPDGGCHVDRFCHLREVRAFLQTGCGVSVDAVWALDRVRHGQGNQ
jgi:hypothetical protein